MAIQRLGTATLIIGVSGSGKTSLLETYAMYLWETYQKVLVLYSWDGGALPTNLQKRMHQGIIRFWRVRTRSAPGLALESLYLATKGYLPRRIDPMTGETSPAVELIPPITTRYALSCPKGHPLKTVAAASLIMPTQCPQCKLLIPREGLQIQETSERTKGFETIGGVAYDGLSSMCQVVMEEMDRMRGQGLIGGEKSSFGGVVSSGSVKFGGNNRADVGFAQGRAQQFVNNSLSIPFLKEGPVFTALSTEGSDKAGLAVIGANLPGQAALEQAPQWFGNICEADSIVDDQGRKHFALKIRPFTDPQGRRHLLKTSASPMGVPEMLIDPPEEDKQPFVNFNLGKLYQLLDEDLRKAMEEELPGAPGVPEGLVEYGEESSPMGTGSPAVTTPVAPKPTPPPVGAGKPVPSTQTATPPASPAATKAPAAPPAPVGPKPPQSPKPPMQAKAPQAATPPPPGMKPPQRAPGT